MKGTDISTETVPSKKIKSSGIEIVSQTVLLSKTKFFLKELQDFIASSSTKSVIYVFGGKGDSISNISLSFLRIRQNKDIIIGPLLSTRIDSDLAIVDQMGRNSMISFSKSSRRRSVSTIFILSPPILKISKILEFLIFPKGSKISEILESLELPQEAISRGSRRSRPRASEIVANSRVVILKYNIVSEIQIFEIF